MPQQSINPATGEMIQVFPDISREAAARNIEKSHQVFSDWKNAGFAGRSRCLRAAAAVLRNESDRYAQIMVSEMGKPVRQAASEVEKCAWVCDYYAENGEELLNSRIISTDAHKSYMAYEPLGVILAIMPWNFPFWQVFRFAAPALMAGNTVLLKHASNVPMCSLAIEEIFTQAGFPQHCFKSLLASSSDVDSIIADKRIRGVSLTGSDAAGRKVAAAAGKYLKKCVLELGGSDPFIVLPDADMDKAVAKAVESRMINNGQSCIAAKRFILHNSIADEFTEKFVSRVSRLKTGDPMDENNELGPVAREDLLEELNRQVSKSVEMGARLLAGGNRIEAKGYYFEPTVLGEVSPGMPAYQEETFGPVAALIRAEDTDRALEIANDSDFGLGASIWSRNISKAEMLAHRVQSGSVFINGMVKSDPRLPFGGIKDSGYGRELSEPGIKEFVNIKTVWIAG